VKRKVPHPLRLSRYLHAWEGSNGNRPRHPTHSLVVPSPRVGAAGGGSCLRTPGPHGNLPGASALRKEFADLPLTGLSQDERVRRSTLRGTSQRRLSNGSNTW
jgi:hypothetical protein